MYGFVNKQACAHGSMNEVCIHMCVSLEWEVALWGGDQMLPKQTRPL